MRIQLPSTNATENTSSPVKSWALIAGYTCFGVLAACALFIFPHTVSLKSNAGLIFELSTGLFFLFLALSSIVEGKGINGLTLIFWALPTRSYNEHRDPNLFAVGVITNFVISGGLLIHGCWTAYERFWH